MFVQINNIKHEKDKLSFFGDEDFSNQFSHQAFVKDIDMLLMTTHLESTGEFTDERQEQLRQCFTAMKEADPKKTVVFGGDLNLREREVT